MATYYVSTLGNDSQIGSILSPWKTIQYGVDMMMPGDTIYIRGGRYNNYNLRNLKWRLKRKQNFQQSIQLKI